MSKLFKFLIGVLLVAAFAFAGVWGARQLTAQDSDQESGDRGSDARRVGVAMPEERRIEEDVPGVGTLRAIRAVEVRPVVSGRVTEVRVDSGQIVSEGDVLIQLDDRAERAALTEAEVTLDETRRDFQRFEELGDSNTAAEARVEQARAAFRRAEAAVASARADLEDRTVSAPFDGTVGLVDIEPGSFLAQDTMVTTLFDLSAVEIELSLPERYFDRVEPGQTVTMQTPAYPDDTFEGVVAVRATQIDLATRSFDVRARIDNPDGRLVGGMFANARLVLDTYVALAIPDDAIISEGLTTFVYTVTDDTAARTEIVAGRSIEALTEVREGLEADDRVVIAGWDDLSDGDTVEIDEDYAQEATN
ncbi:efflux RND transporter periplasmic adaptor subunit [Salipiger sp. IMCC34102]|uniref:efflux RND transporter periplasmic adaptor subunit n=1 Tax=Salipiger sp. IMCC34102 TaxID=2510647 RepID=UPI00101CF750|nr:efflux RND transporter periplasmic adaptor subunit [Salipiger sp. IMCC34102]RYH02554.1 efflux RND transporter periplasmic adaptor subunit [Salipiger sp. IMCC34102]